MNKTIILHPGADYTPAPSADYVRPKRITLGAKGIQYGLGGWVKRVGCLHSQFPQASIYHRVLSVPAREPHWKGIDFGEQSPSCISSVSGGLLSLILCFAVDLENTDERRSKNLVRTWLNIRSTCVYIKVGQFCQWRAVTLQATCAVSNTGAKSELFLTAQFHRKSKMGTAKIR